MSKQYICPNCSSDMELLSDTRSHFRMCLACNVLQWEKDGKTESRYSTMKKLPENESDKA